MKNINESTHKLHYNILFTFLMDRGRAPYGIGHLMIARPKDGLFRLHASWIYLSYAGFDCLAAILCH